MDLNNQNRMEQLARTVFRSKKLWSQIDKGFDYQVQSLTV